MIQKLGVALRFYAFYTESKLGKTGLTVTADVYENGVSIVSGASATEIGGGLYSYSLAAGSNDANGEYAAVFKTSTSTVDAQWIPALWTTPAWLTALGTATVTFSGPLVTESSIANVVPGDDYFSADARSWDFTYTTVPVLTGATITMGIRLRGRAANALLLTGSVLSATQIRFQPTSAETVLLTPGTVYDYQVQAVLSGTSHVTTLETGTLTTLLNLPTP